MSSELKIEIEGDILKTAFPKYAGTDQGAAWFTEIFDKANDSGLKKVFLDCRELGQPVPIFDLYELAEHISRSIPARGLKLGCYLHPDASHPDKFFEVLTANRGVSAFGSFDKDEVLDWLNR